MAARSASSTPAAHVYVSRPGREIHVIRKNPPGKPGGRGKPGNGRRRWQRPPSRIRAWIGGKRGTTVGLRSGKPGEKSPPQRIAGNRHGNHGDGQPWTKQPCPEEERRPSLGCHCRYGRVWVKVHVDSEICPESRPTVLELDGAGRLARLPGRLHLPDGLTST